MYLGAVMSLSSSTPNPPASTPLRDNPFDWNLSTNLQPNGADIPQYVAPASTQYAQAPEQHNMPQVDAFGFSQSPSATGRQDLHSNQASQSLPSSGSAEEYAFGSDPGFGADHSFVPDHGHTTESIATNMLDPMSYLNPQSSADNTRAPSPQTSGQQAYLSSPSVDPAISAAEAPVTVNGERRSPQKRRLSAVEEHEAPASPSPAPKKRRGRPAKPSGEKAANGSGTKAAKAKKEPRIPLTDEQRRENHLESEQNRRDRDNAEFEALQAIIPGLDDHRTKSGHYLYALKWLKRVIADNESMENLLQSSAATNPEPVGQ